jgi:hypothetical protein
MKHVTVVIDGIELVNQEVDEVTVQISDASFAVSGRDKSAAPARNTGGGISSSLADILSARRQQQTAERAAAARADYDAEKADGS